MPELKIFQEFPQKNPLQICPFFMVKKKSLRTLEATEGSQRKNQINILFDFDSLTALLGRLVGCFAKLEIAQTFSGIDRLAGEDRFGVMLNE